MQINNTKDPDKPTVVVLDIEEDKDALDYFNEIWLKLNARKEAYYKTPIGRIRLLLHKVKYWWYMNKHK